MDRLRERDNRCRNKEEEGRETAGASELAVSDYLCMHGAAWLKRGKIYVAIVMGHLFVFYN